MSDQEFIDLLNRYLDHEVSAAEAARLEAEVQGNPQRRQIYRQYCQMQKACKLLAVDFQSESVPEGQKKVLPFQGAAARTQSQRIYIWGAVAAAACVALLFVSRGGPRPEHAADGALRPVAVQSAPLMPAARLVAEVPPSAATPSGAGGLVQRPMLVNDPLLLAGRAADAALLRGATPDEHLAWIGALQMAPVPQRVPIETLRFEMQPTILPQDNRGLTSRSGSGEAAAEMTAFRFVK